jgi:FkbM family methyltransferase
MRLSKKEVVYRVPKLGKVHGHFLCRTGTNDGAIIEEVWNKRFYFTDDFVVEKNDVVIDIGAHVGAFTILAGLLGAKRVYSFEPHPRNYAQLVLNVQRNNLSKVVRDTHGAITDSDNDYLDLWEHKENTGSHSVVCDVGKNKFTVPNYNIRDYSIVDIDFMKLDCEGAEYAILHAQNLENVKKLALEWHNREKAEVLRTFIQNQGFEILYFKGNDAQGKMLARKK